MNLLEVHNLHVSVEGKEILHGVDLAIEPGKIHVLMGPNGSGKSSLANALMGHPKYTVTQGTIRIGDTELIELSPDERAKLGLFLAFQHPLEIPGVTVSNFLRTAYKATHDKPLSVPEFKKRIATFSKKLKLDESFLSRYLNEGFSGGEKKKVETLQMLFLEPKIILLDETDSGLDVDALKAVSTSIHHAVSEHTGVLVITHYQRILRYLQPDKVHILMNGKIVKEGGLDLVTYVEEHGYEEVS